MKKVITFGEIMLRLQPPSFKKIEQASSFDSFFSGSESNVAVALSQYGDQSVYVTKIPTNSLGDACLNEIRRYGVDTSYIARDNGRMGLFFIEKGASLRSSNIIYDRENSSFAHSTAEDYDFETIFSDASWFHYSGITPALSQPLIDITQQAITFAKKKNITVSCDVNYRAKLWDKIRAGKVLSTMLQDNDVLIINENQAIQIFGIEKNNYEKTIRKLVTIFHSKYVVLTIRRTLSSEVNKVSAILYDGKYFYQSKEYVLNLVDRLGGGDALTAGFIHALSHSDNMQYVIDFAVASSCYKQTIEGDMTIASEKDINQILESESNGRFER